MQIGVGRDVEHAPQTFDVRLEQWRWITQIEPGVHDAVVHDVPVGHRLAQRVLVVKAAVASLDLEIVDRHRRAGLAEVNPHSSPRSASCRVTWDPTKPLAPITRTRRRPGGVVFIVGILLKSLQ